MTLRNGIRTVLTIVAGVVVAASSRRSRAERGAPATQRVRRRRRRHQAGLGRGSPGGRDLDDARFQVSVEASLRLAVERAGRRSRPEP